MLFNSIIFFIFLFTVLPIFYLLKTKTWKNTFLLFASYFFYGYWDWRFCFLLAISTIIDYFIGKKLYSVEKKSFRKILLIASLAANLGILGFFKYFNFFVDSFDVLISNFGYKLDFLHLNIILPVGISFYTFQTLSYTIDIYRRKIQPTSNFIDFALFVSFFPQLVAGPIERASNLLPQLNKVLKPSSDQIKKGIVLIVYGLFKKVLIGDAAGRIVDHIFAQPEFYFSIELLSALILFSIQIYADFSGYSNIARGLAKLLGIELMKNFEQPYLSSNITEFWRRWHISLSSWLKDYLYISLGGNRFNKYRTYLNLMITMLLGGLWHGASWNFVIWGGLHGLYLSVHKLILKGKKVADYYIFESLNSLFLFIFKVFITYLLVLFAWLFFRVKTFHLAMCFIQNIIHWQKSELAIRFVTITSTFLIITILFDFLEYYTKRHSFILLIPNKYIRYGILTAMLATIILFLFQTEPLPFVYFQF